MWRYPFKLAMRYPADYWFHLRCRTACRVLNDHRRCHRSQCEAHARWLAVGASPSRHADLARFIVGDAHVLDHWWRNRPNPWRWLLDRIIPPSAVAWP